MRRFVSAAETVNEQLPAQINHFYFRDGLSELDTLVLVRAHIENAARHPFHAHPEMDEIIYVLEGEMEQWVEQEKRILRAGDSVLIPRGVVHGCYNDSGAPCKFLAIPTPSKIKGPDTVDHSTQEPWRSLKP